MFDPHPVGEVHLVVEVIESAICDEAAAHLDEGTATWSLASVCEKRLQVVGRLALAMASELPSEPQKPYLLH